MYFLGIELLYFMRKPYFYKAFHVSKAYLTVTKWASSALAHEDTQIQLIHN